MTARALLASTIALLFSLTTIAAEPKKAAADHAPTAIVLCYHIVEGAGQSRFEVSRETFRQHLRYLSMTGYNVIPLRHLYEYVSGKRATIPKNAVVITIDDGWVDTYTEAFPELKKRNLPFTVFIYPNIIGKTANALSWAQIREMAKAGVDIQSHSYTHPFLTKRRHSFDEDRYAAWLQRELAESKRVLEKETGRKVQFLAYPYGDYDSRVAETAAKAGYDAAVTCDFGAVRRGSDPLKMKRVVIDRKMDFAAFRRYLGADKLQLAEITPTPGKIVDGGVPTIITAKIPNFQKIDPKSVGMALLSITSAMPYTYDANSGAVTLVVRDTVEALKTKYHRALVWATDKTTGKRIEASWTFRLPDPNAPPPPVTPAPAPANAIVPAGTPAAATTPATPGSPTLASAIPLAHGAPKR